MTKCLNSMNSLDKATELKQRTKRFAIRIVNLFRSLPHSPDAQTLGKQLLRSGTSVAANYRSVCRARSQAEFIARMGVVVEKQTKPFSGSSLWVKQESFAPREQGIY
jgi:hypothetical protein